MRGFTLVELILVFGIVAMVSALSIPFLLSSQVSSDLNSLTITLVSTLRRAQQQALSGQNQASWGVYFDSGNDRYILFQGADFTSRDPDFDLVVDYPAIFSLLPDFGSEIVFGLYSGQPSTAGNIQFISSNEGVKNISIDSYGKIEKTN